MKKNNSTDARKSESQGWGNFLKNSSFSYLSCKKGQWKDGNGKIYLIRNMDEEHTESCIKIVQRDIDFVNEGGFENQLDTAMIKDMFDIDGRRNIEKYFGASIVSIKNNMVKVAIVALTDKKDELENISNY